MAVGGSGVPGSGGMVAGSGGAGTGGTTTSSGGTGAGNSCGPAATGGVGGMTGTGGTACCAVGTGGVTQATGGSPGTGGAVQATGGSPGTGGAVQATGGTGGTLTTSGLDCSGDFTRIADFDGDGTPDCVRTVPSGLPDNWPVYSTGTVYLAFLKGLGNGTFDTTGIVTQIPLSPPFGAQAVDLSADGRADLAIYKNNSTPVMSTTQTYLRAQANGTFVDVCGSGFTSSVINYGSSSLPPADFNGDGKLDLLTAFWNIGDNSQAVSWVLISDKGCTNTSAGFIVGAHGTLSLYASGDVNGDGAQDIVGILHFVSLAGTTNTTNVVIAKGTVGGTPGAAVTVPGTTGATSVALSDLNGDGKLDLAVGLPAGTVPMYGDGAGHFSTTAP